MWENVINIDFFFKDRPTICSVNHCLIEKNKIHVPDHDFETEEHTETCFLWTVTPLVFIRWTEAVTEVTIYKLLRSLCVNSTLDPMLEAKPLLLSLTVMSHHRHLPDFIWLIWRSDTGCLHRRDLQALQRGIGRPLFGFPPAFWIYHPFPPIIRVPCGKLSPSSSSQASSLSMWPTSCVCQEQ